MKNIEKSQPKHPFDIMIKVLLIGNSGVGKSCILLQFSQQKYINNTFTTIGVDHKTKYIRQNDQDIKLEIWDTAGQDRFKTITTSYYKGAHGIVIVYDITSRVSFDNVRMWLEEIEKNASQKVLRVLVGNKCDLDQRREVEYKQGLELANSLGIPFFEASAKSANNVQNIFNTLVGCAIDRNNYTKSQQLNKTKISLAKEKKKRGYCC